MTWLETNFKGDRTIWLIVILLSFISTLAVYSSTGTLAYKYQSGNTEYYILKHGFILLFGFGLMYFFHLASYTVYARFARLAFIITVPLLILTLFMGTNINDANRWITLPIIGLSFQTSDLAKLSLILYLARLISKKQESINDFKASFIPIVIPVFIVCGLILPANFSTAAVLFSTSMVLMFIGRVPLKFIFGLLGTAVVAFALFIGIAKLVGYNGRISTWGSRIENFTSKKSTDEGDYQVQQAKIAIATGGILGKGPGQSSQRNFLPHPYSDFIFAIIIEEYGLAGGCFVVLLYLMLFYRAIQIVRRTERAFAAMITIGCAFSLVFQALINMAVAVHIFPVTGQPLPMLSMGGTSIWFTSFAIGIILSVSSEIDKKVTNKTAEVAVANNIKVIISGGGTGGHIFPAIAIANALKAINSSIEILFVGAEGKMEMEKVPAAGYKIEGLPIAGIKRELSLDNLSFPLKLVKSLSKAGSVMKNFNPDVAVGVGGYASGPMLYMASRKGIPTLIQEQNSYPGITNKILSKKASKVCVAYENMDRFFEAGKIIFTGNPVREDIKHIDGKKLDACKFFGIDPSKPTLLVVGGSQGARSINRAIKAGLNQINDAGVQLIWQTGKLFFSEAKEAIESLNVTSLHAFDFISKMDLAYAAADAVVARAGASTVSELCIVKKPAILVPLPTAAEDHQTKNCIALVERNAALLVNDSDASSVLVNNALALISNDQQRNSLSENIAVMARPDAAQQIAKEVLRLVSK